MQDSWKEIPGGVTAAPGFKASGVEAGIKKQGKDVALIFSETPARGAAVFTQNLVKAAPLIVTAAHLKNKTVRAVVINSGNANACNGEQGLNDARRMAQKTASLLNLEPAEVVVASTGVIGVPLPMERIESGIALASKELSPDGGEAAAQAIMTTDLRAKEIAVKLELGGAKITIGAMAKGSGMIHPKMATMLAFITTDVNITKEMLQTALRRANDNSFNMITVDGDTSTNDMALIFSNCRAHNRQIDSENDQFEIFVDALEYVCTFLAQEICRDGEGATKLIEIDVTGALSEADARKAAKSIANSNLVKTAVFGEDANWGRILVAAGYSGAAFDPDRVDISMESCAGSEVMARQGRGLSFDEQLAKKILEQDEIKIVLNFNSGKYCATAWTCDFSYDYVKINADYRT